MKVFIERSKSKLITAMPLVKKNQKQLLALNNWWGKISLIAKINSNNMSKTIIDDMQSTKDKFSLLQNELVDNLLLEHMQKRVVADASKSQVAIDILIRNLFERTADVGFLATDDDIRKFIQHPTKTDKSLASIENRLAEYVKKYSVYNEIVILTPAGDILANLDKNNRLKRSSDPLIQATLTTKDEYLETFAYSDLQATQDKSLIYSSKITAGNSPDSPVIGVLCLCFRFNDEMEGIFTNLLEGNGNTHILILDDKKETIASSNRESITLKTSLHSLLTSNANTPKLANINNAEYIFTHSETKSYQGFTGLSWAGVAVTPVNGLLIARPITVNI